MMKKVIILDIFLVLLVLPFVLAVSEERYIIELKDNKIDKHIEDSIIAELDLGGLNQLVSTRVGLGKNIIVVSNVSREILESEDSVINLEPDYKVHSLEESSQWNYEAIGLNFSVIGSNFGEGVKMAVLDTGVNYNLLSIASGYDFVNEDNDTFDDNGHGTLVSQILKNPGTDFPLKDSQIYSVKVLNHNGEGYVSDVIEGINWAIDNDVKIILMSFGGEQDSLFLKEAIEEAYNQGTLIIAAVGNDNSSNIVYPARYEQVISVGSINRNLEKSIFSNYGEDLDFVAPGENIIIFDGTNKFEVQGTSFSVPHMGIVAIAYWSKNINLTHEGIKDMLRETALDLGEEGKDDEFGWGLARYEKEDGKKIFIQGHIYLVDSSSKDYNSAPISNSKIIIQFSNNKSYEIFSEKDGSFNLEFNNVNETLDKLEVYIDDCLVFSDESSKVISEGISLDISIFDISHCKLKSETLNSLAFIPSCSNFPNSLVYKLDKFSFKNQSKTPILLVHGWSNEADGSCNYSILTGYSCSWESLQVELQKDYDVFNLEYWPANLSNRKNAFLVDYEINELLQTYYPSQNKFNVVSHSMGGLAVRGYIQNMARDCDGNTKNYRNNIDRLVLIASPLYGSYFANIINNNTPNDILKNHPKCQEFLKGINIVFDFDGPNLEGRSEGTFDLEVGSNFTWELNRKELNKEIKYLTLVGRRTADRNFFMNSDKTYCASNKKEINDGIVSVINANMLEHDVSLIILDRFHSGPVKLGINIVNAINKDDKAGKIATLFFKGNLSNLTINPFLNTFETEDQRIGELYHNPLEISNSLPSELKDKGSFVLQLLSSENLLNENSLELQEDGKKYGLEMNKNTKRFFYVNISDVPNKSIDFTTMLPIGYYDIIVNGYNSNKKVPIFGGRVMLVQNGLDEDQDGWDMQRVGGSDCNDNNPSIKPNSTEMCNEIDDNCNNEIDEDFDNGEVCSIGVGECNSKGVKICSLDGSETICNAIPKEPTEEICDDLDNNCNGEVDEGDACKINLIVNSPNFSLFPERRIQFNLTTNQMVDEITYIDNTDDRPREIILCKNCNGYGHDRIRTQSFNEGFHNVSFRAYFNDTFIEERREFIIDSKNPRISKTEPRRGFASGIFNVEFTEDNPIQLTLFYGNNSIKNHSVDLDNECVLDRTRYKCETKVDLSEFDGNEIQYWFNLTDVIGNTDKSRENELDVDTTKPALDYFNYFIDKRRVEFIFNVTEENFDEINYIDWNDSRPRKTRICSRLRNGICEVRKSFGAGEHNLTINILDEAGNFIETTAQFTII